MLDKMLVLILLSSSFAFSQESNSIPPDCWKEYKHDNLPSGVSEYCPLILCSDSSSICYLKEENEMYTDIYGWFKLNDNQIQLGEDGPVYNILKWTESDLNIQSVDYPNFKIYLKK